MSLPLCLLQLCFYYKNIIAQASKSKEINTTQRPIQRNQRKNKRIGVDDIASIASRGLTTCTPTTPSNKSRFVFSELFLSKLLRISQETYLGDFILMLLSQPFV